MGQLRYPGSALAGLAVAAALTAGCGATSQTVPIEGVGTLAPTVSAPTVSAPTVSAPTADQAASAPSRVSGRGQGGGRTGSGTGSSVAGGRLPADWPPDLPVPQGRITGSTGSSGRWTVFVVAAGAARQVRHSAVSLYSSVGFTAISDSVLNKGSRQITLVAENRDHSATQTNLVIGVSAR